MASENKREGGGRPLSDCISCGLGLSRKRGINSIYLRHSCLSFKTRKKFLSRVRDLCALQFFRKFVVKGHLAVVAGYLDGRPLDERWIGLWCKTAVCCSPQTPPLCAVVACPSPHHVKMRWGPREGAVCPFFFFLRRSWVVVFNTRQNRQLYNKLDSPLPPISFDFFSHVDGQAKWLFSDFNCGGVLASKPQTDRVITGKGISSSFSLVLIINSCSSPKEEGEVKQNNWRLL